MSWRRMHESMSWRRMHESMSWRRVNELEADASVRAGPSL
jgi:hypothetical protein